MILRRREERRAPEEPGPRVDEREERRPVAVAPDTSGPGPAECTYLLIFGVKGMGKTTYARELYRARIRAGGSGVWIDPSGRNGDLGTVARSPVEAWSTIRRALERHDPYSVVVQWGWKANAGTLWELLYRLGGLLLVLDEAQRYANAHRIDPDLRELIAQGRNAQIDVVTTTRTPPELHGDLKGNPDAVVTFRQSRRHYAEVLNREFFNLRDGAERIMELAQFHYVRWTPAGVQHGDLHPLPWAGSVR